MIQRGNLILHLEGVRIFVISRTDRVHRKIASCRLVEIIKKTLGIRKEIQKHIFSRSNLFPGLFTKEVGLPNLNGSR